MVFPSSGALQSSLIDRVPLICRPTNAQSCVFSSYDVIPRAQGGGGASAPKPPPPGSAPAAEADARSNVYPESKSSDSSRERFLN